MSNVKRNTNYLESVDFGDEAADDISIDELISYFVEQISFKRYIDFKKRFLIARARKGIGKSALLQWVHYHAQQNPSALVIKCRGAELTRTKFKLTTPLETPAARIYDWMQRICALINRELAKKINFAFTDNAIGLVEVAELEGFKQKNIISCLLDRLRISVEGTSIQAEKTKSINEIESLKKASHANAIIIIDDLDATFQNTNEELLELSTFFSACRYLIQDIDGICIRVSLRSDVWPIIRRFDESLDKVDQYINEITWTEKDFTNILTRRIQASIQNIEAKDAIHEVFQSPVEWGKKSVPINKVLFTLSYERPRWGIQLCKLAQDYAMRNMRSKICKSDIDAVWGMYGQKRLDDINSEQKNRCPQIADLINAFRTCDRLLGRDKLLEWIDKNISNRISVTIDGHTTRSSLEIAQFLYKIGFIVARTNDKTGYCHYRFEEMPDLLNSKTQKDSEFTWEIHPCYREALDISKMNYTQRKQAQA